MASAADSAASIGDYALIGDCRSAALVSRAGSVDWLCLPQFSSPAIFGALLDPLAGGRFRIGARGATRSDRRYLPGSALLETQLQTADGRLRLTELMPLPDRPGLQPMRELLRIAEGLDGSVELDIEIDPRPDYGRRRPRLEQRGEHAWIWSWDCHWLQLRAEHPLQPQGTALHARLRLGAGERCAWSLSYGHGDIGSCSPLGAAAQQRLQASLRWWQDWSARARYDGPDRAAVLRSAVTLKLLTHALSGAVIAAPTSSLPEVPGGDLNWDYRYCWLRDAALTMRAFTELGYLDEARRFLDWLLHATRLTWPQLQVLYDVYGRPELPESTLDHWRGYRGSRPVRIGNAAYAQRQLDVYGAVCFAAREYVHATGELQRDEARLLRGFGEAVCRSWRQPDHSIWELRGAERHYTFSKLMCWSALDALVTLAQRGHLRVPAHFASERAALQALIDARGYDEGLASYVGVLGGNQADASLLLMAALGFRDARDPRLRSTHAFLRQRLERRGLWRRYERAKAEGAFGICSFWAVDDLARCGEHAAARRAFDRVSACANDLGLFAEEIELDSDAPLGNFPQAYTHVGLINAALGLARAAEA